MKTKAETGWNRRGVTLSALVGLASAGCFSTVGRLHFAKEEQTQGTVTLSAGDVRFAAELTVQHAENAVARYDIELLQDGKVVSRATCLPFPLDEKRSCSYRFGEGALSCSVVMDCRAHLTSGGKTLVRARFSVLEKSPDFTFERANLAIGQ